MLSSRIFLALVAAFAVAACSSNTTTTTNNTGGGSGSADGGTSPGTGTHSTGNGGTCCLNGAFYDCTTKDAFDKCAGFDIDACMKACAFGDGPCMDTCFTKWEASSHDPSTCTRTASRDDQCKAAPAPGPGPGPGPSPSGCKGSGTSPNGAACSIDSHCCSDNCTSGACQGNSAGSPCSIDSHCTSNNCTNGECQL